MWAWWIGFSSGYLYNSNSMTSSNIRCVTNNSTPLAQCSFAGGNWNEAENTCTRHCSGKPSNTVWNGTTTYPATYSDGSWSNIASAYNEETEGTCHFKCAQNYFWDGSACVTPCDNTCMSVQNSTGECNATSLTDFSCGCKTGSTWNASESKCLVDPANLAECSPQSATPCKDSSTGLTWSAIASISMDWENAKSYCEELDEGRLSWYLPTISELRTLIQNCSATQSGGSCGITDACPWSDCRNDACEGCSPDSTDKYSKLGETSQLWSSSVYIVSNYSSYAWSVDFGNGYVGYEYDYYDVRCVRCDTGFIWDGTSCVSAPPREAECQDKPANTVWNTVDTITQTYNGADWEPSTTPVYNEEASDRECRFKCAQTYFWDGSACVTEPTVDPTD